MEKFIKMQVETKLFLMAEAGEQKSFSPVRQRNKVSSEHAWLYKDQRHERIHSCTRYIVLNLFMSFKNKKGSFNLIEVQL